MNFFFRVLHTLFLTWAPYHWLWIIFISTFMTLISNYTEGLQMIEVKLDNGISWGEVGRNIINLIKGKRD